MGRRHLARELALKVLFEGETDGAAPDRSLEYHANEARADEEVTDFARTLIGGVREHRDTIDARLREASQNWDLDGDRICNDATGPSAQWSYPTSGRTPSASWSAPRSPSSRRSCPEPSSSRAQSWS